MTLTDQVYAQAVMLAGADEQSEALLQLLCHSAVAGLTAQLREGISVDACKADFVAAASLYALAALSETDAVNNLAEIKISDVTLKRDSASAAAKCLRSQAKLIMFPYVQDQFAFRRI